jgi:arginyl-tRNA synthetase
VTDLQALRHGLARAAVDRMQRSVEPPAGTSYAVLDRVGPVRLAGALEADVDALSDVDGAVLAFELLRHPAGAVLTLDPALLSRDAVANPGYAVRYAHSRCAALLRNAADLGVEPDGPQSGPDARGGRRPEGRDRLLDRVASYRTVLRTAALRAQPHRLARHLLGTAEAVLRLVAHADVLPRGEESPSSRQTARLGTLGLLRDAGTVLREGLLLLGVPAPVRL